MMQQQAGSLQLRGYKVPLSLSDLIWLEGNSNYSLLHRSNAPNLMTARTLVRWQKMLPEFIRISRGALVNPTHIARLHRISTYQVELTLTNGTVLLVARRRIAEVFRAVKSANN
ncbi:LytTR family DNA-binding domain-containing protein [Larkinella sp. GY13]|jgi:DNA-binding LytR/AlgR family response regulator|uniref:LytTR family DNA-binding domain-containing protein n=1 Tax=unclassified Larkinella TaxID=2620233 RepID=UPI0011113A7F|nr:LytTR family DNA-binding domain-containing protein [Larkinella sp. C7]